MALGFMRRHRKWLFGFLWIVIAAFMVGVISTAASFQAPFESLTFRTHATCFPSGEIAAASYSWTFWSAFRTDSTGGRPAGEAKAAMAPRVKVRAASVRFTREGYDGGDRTRSDME